MFSALKDPMEYDRVRTDISFLTHPLPTWIVSPVDLSVVVANQAAERTYGYETGGMNHLNFTDLFQEESRILFLEKTLDLKDVHFLNGPYYHISAQGKILSVSLHASCLNLDTGNLYQFSTVVNEHDPGIFHDLLEEVQRYRTYIQQSSQGIFCQEYRVPVPVNLNVDEILQIAMGNSTITECNDALARMYGYDKADELKGIHSDQLLDLNDEGTRAFLKKFIENGFRIVNAESCEKDRFGNTKYFLNSAIGIVEDGYLKRVWGTQQDITEKKNTEEKIKLLALLVEQTSDVLTSADLEFRPITWNQAAEKIYGLKAKEVTGRDLRDFIALHYQGYSRDEVRSIITKEGEWRGEAYFIRPTDKKNVTLLICFKLLRNEHGKELGYLISATDISERKEAEYRLRESENRFREVADTAPVMIWMIDEHIRVTYHNVKWKEFTGVDIVGTTTNGWQNLVHEDDIEEAKLKYNLAFQQRKPVTLIYRLRTASGNYRWVHDVGVPRFLSDGSFIGYIGSVVDIEEQKQKEHQLHYQATVLENVSDIIVTTDLDFVVKRWNKSASDFYGITREEAIGKRIFELVQFGFTGTTNEESLAQLNNNGHWEGEVSLVNNKGETNYFLQSVKYMYDSQGNSIGFLAVGRDITERKKMEAHLKTSEQFYRTLIADSLDGVILLDVEGRISFSSPSVKNVLGFEAAEVMGRNGFEFVHPDDLIWAFNSFQREVEENPEIKFITIRLKKKNGEWVWCMVRGHNLLNNPYIKSIVIYFHDDSRRKQANDALKESEKRFRNLIKDLHTGVLLQDAEGQILMSNNAMKKMFGDEEEELLGKQIWTIYEHCIREDGTPLPHEERPSFKALLTREVVGDQVMGVWHPARREYVWLIICADPIFNEEGNLTHIICSFTDITERKKLEAKLLAHQRQLTQATIDGQEAERTEIGRELHDNIGQQLTTIKLFLDLARNTADDTTNEMVSLALKGVSDVINEVRAMTRNLVPYSLRDLSLVESVQELVDSISQAQRICIELQTSNFDEECLAENQRLTFFRIIQEQLNNIIKHASAQNACIRLAKEGEMFSLEVEDDGVGFNPKKIRKGLGLINIRNRAALFGGEAKIISGPGKGCLVRVSFPAIANNNPAVDSYQ